MTHNLVTRKFVLEVQKLIEKGIAGNYVEVANAIGWNKSGMSQVVQGKRNVPISVYRRFTDTYNLLPPERLPENGTPETELIGLRADFLKDDLIAALKDSNKLLKEQLDINSRELSHKVNGNAALLAALIELVLVIASKDKAVYKQSVDILRRRKLESSFV